MTTVPVRPGAPRRRRRATAGRAGRSPPRPAVFPEDRRYPTMACPPPAAGNFNTGTSVARPAQCSILQSYIANLNPSGNLMPRQTEKGPGPRAAAAEPAEPRPTNNIRSCRNNLALTSRAICLY